MEDSESQNMDASSIKPVSSLRSHFEGMKTPTQSGPTPVFRRAAGIPVHVEPERGRSSLDIPRKGSPWNDTGDSRSKELQQSTKSNDRVVPRVLESSTKSRTRPMSMGPWSPPQTPPAVKIQAPRSPPKKTHIVPASAPSVTSPPAPLPPGGNPLKSRYAPLLPQSNPLNNFPRTLQESHPAPGTETDAKTNISKKPSQPAMGKVYPMPPPVNRAVKPKLVATRSSSGSRSGWTTLEPVQDNVGNRISPFNTPPSSDGGLDMDDATDKPRDGVRTQQALSQTQREGYFPPPPTRHTADSRRDGRNGSTTMKQHSRDAREYGFAPSGSTSDIFPRGSPVTTPPLQDGRVGRTGRSETIYASQPRRTMQVRPRPANQITRSTTDFLPPPKRNVVSGNQNPSLSRVRESTDPAAIIRPRTSGILNGPVDSHTEVRRMDKEESDNSNTEFGATPSLSSDYPDASQTNRRPPRARSGKQQIDTTYDTRIFDICSRHICSTGYLTKAWEVTTGEMIFDMSHGERDFKITALAFKPSIKSEEEGLRVWLGSNYGDIQEIDLESHSVTQSKSGAHGRREILKIYRHQASMWSLDEEGKLYVWLPDGSGLPNLEHTPLSYRVPKGHTFSIIIKDNLWFATGKEIRIFKPGASGDVSFFVIQQPLQQSSVGEITSGAVISNQLDRVYFGHTDGKVSVYSSTDFGCIGVINVSVYKINTLAGVGFYLWAGYNTGMIYVYDTRTNPWHIKKDWLAHDGPVLNIVADRSSVWKLGYLQVASIGIDNTIRMWDGMLRDDWLEDNMHEHDTEYCEFEEITTVVATWNAGASTPTSLRHEEKNNNFFREVIRTNDPPDIVVFGFQELVDLEDKKLTAKSLFKGNKRKDSSEHEHMSRQYRDWRDFLVRLIEDNMPANQHYHLLQTANMVGLFSCIFVKASLRTHIRDLQVAEVKRGLGGFHGNKGALLLRFVLHDSSLCFVNCHLAAGQTQTVHRNNDITAILDSTAFSMERDPARRIDNFIGGGDGCMVMDHEICVLNGDLNYRIDTMGRDAVIKAIRANDLFKLLERDQLLVSRRRNPAFRLRVFNESPITFAPTYKYDIGTDNYDSSEKHRSPAWCDRILYRGVGRIKQLNYQRHDLRVSDHRPVSAVFKMRVKSISAKKRILVWQQCQERFAELMRTLSKDVQIDYLVSVLGVDPQEAARLVQR